MVVERLTAIGWGLVTFAVVVALGIIVIQKFGDQIVQCPTIGGGAATWNTTQQLCVNGSGTTATGSGAGYTAIASVATQLSSSGLTGWIPVIIVVVIAGLVLALFGGKGKKY